MDLHNMLPILGSHPIQETVEVQQPGGTFRMWSSVWAMTGRSLPRLKTGYDLWASSLRTVARSA